MKAKSVGHHFVWSCIGIAVSIVGIWTLLVGGFGNFKKDPVAACDLVFSVAHNVYDEQRGVSAMTDSYGAMAPVALKADEVAAKDWLKRYGGAQLTASQFDEVSATAESALKSLVITFGAGGDGKLDFSVDGKMIDVKSIDVKFVDSANSFCYPQSFGERFVEKYSTAAVYGAQNFAGDSEIMITESVLELFDIQKEDALGKTVSLFIGYKMFEQTDISYVVLDDDNDPSNRVNVAEVGASGGTVRIFKDYHIVGVIDDRYFGLNSLTENEPRVWISLSSVISDGELALPEFTVRQTGSDIYTKSMVVTYPTTDYVEYSNTVTEQGKTFLFLCGNWFRRTGAVEYLNNFVTPQYETFLQFGDYKTAKDAYDIVLGHLDENADWDVTYTFFDQSFRGLVAVQTAAYAVGGIMLCVGIAIVTAAVVLECKKRPVPAENSSGENSPCLAITLIAAILTAAASLAMCGVLYGIGIAVLNSFARTVYPAFSFAFWGIVTAVLISAWLVVRVVLAGCKRINHVK